jgi:pimeloyl-ACP methyl ester carboxylesterase
VRRPPRHETVRIRDLNINLTRWGPAPSESMPAAVLLHGWQDCAATFQFMVDAFARDWPLAALDWRGFGRSEWPQSGYWFPDYLADLDALLDQLSPGAAVRLIGHSMGGNVACLYAGLRPERVLCVANLEGLGMARTTAADAPALYRQWLDQVKAAPKLKDYASLEQLSAVIRFRYPRFSAATAGFVAAAWSRQEGGRVRLLGDSRHRWVTPTRYQREDAEACWRQITAPLLMLWAEESGHLDRLGADGHEDAFRKVIPHIQIARVAGAGHMLHIEQPEIVAALIEKFLDAH